MDECEQKSHDKFSVTDCYSALFPLSEDNVLLVSENLST